ncbi:MAG: RHS repeat-associated core domain-containing protein [Candidatus Acidiferrales bacterium]
MKSTGKVYWHGPGGEVLLEGDPAQTFIYDEHVYFNAQRIARRSQTSQTTSSVFYFFSDHLGSARIVTNSSGTVVEDSGFYPFGAERVVTDTLNNNYKFTGQERDPESGLDYFIARHYAFTLGRFLQPDSTSYSSAHNPQSWNLYAYTLNNPLKFVDPTGNSVEVTNCPDERECTRAIANATGNAEAAARVSSETLTVKAPWHKRIFGIKTEQKTFIKIEGDIKSFRGLSSNAAKLADLVETKTNVQFSISPTYTGHGGQGFVTPGGFAGTPSLGFSEPFAVVAPNPAPFDTDTRGLIGGQIGEIPGANLQETAAHELLGHMWAEIFGGQPAGTTSNARAAVVAENEVRKTDPSRGLKIRHGVFGQVIRKEDLPKD